MKRFILPALVMTLVMMLALTACGGNDTADEQPQEQEQEQPQEQDTQEEPEQEQEEPEEEIEITAGNPIAPADSEIVGYWSWDAISAFEYVFNADGTGTRGIQPDLDEFDWRVYDNNFLVMEFQLIDETWTYQVFGDILIFTSRPDNFEFTYTRLSESGAGGTDNDEAEPQAASPMRGSWDGDVYTNTHLGLTFTLPDGWEAMSDADMAAMMGLAVAIVEDAGGYIPDDVDAFIDMVAMNPLTGDSIQILFERQLFAMTPAEYITLAAEGMEAMGITVDTSIAGTTPIGNADWHAMATEMDLGIATAYGRQYISMGGGFTRSIVITYMEGGITPAQILAQFN